MAPKISYVLGIYNAERTLEECLDSILMQNISKKDYEVLIIDGGSTDRTIPIIKRYIKTEKNIKLFHNPYKLSEGKGNGKDQGIKYSKGEFIVLLDHDNILKSEEWIIKMLEPFKDQEVMAVQSLLEYKTGDTNFLKYVNSLGVEDPFATKYSLVAQIVLNAKKFVKKNNYYLFSSSPKNILFFGANGCIFRKSVFQAIGGYTRDVDVSADMATKNMVVAVPILARIHHNTSNNMLNFLKKKITYFYYFISKEYKTKSFSWTQVGNPPSRIRFFLMVAINLTLINSFIEVIPKLVKDRKLFWLLHPFYVFFITLIYGIITITKIRNFLDYL